MRSLDPKYKVYVGMQEYSTYVCTVYSIIIVVESTYVKSVASLCVWEMIMINLPIAIEVSTNTLHSTVLAVGPVGS